MTDEATNTTILVDVDGAANGENYQELAVLQNVTGTTPQRSGRRRPDIDNFWLS